LLSLSLTMLAIFILEDFAWGVTAELRNDKLQIYEAINTPLGCPEVLWYSRPISGVRVKVSCGHRIGPILSCRFNPYEVESMEGRKQSIP
jgi:hypothetical protein